LHKINGNNPPGHLTALSKALWRNVVGDYHLEPHHIALLTLACGEKEEVP
jgi:hypothetical protein